MCKFKFLITLFLILSATFLSIDMSNAIFVMSHTSNSTVIPVWSTNNVSLNLTFTVANGAFSNDSINTIRITVPTDYLYVSGECPVNWTLLWTSPNFYCSTSQPLTPSYSVDIILNVTAPSITSNSVKSYNWLVSTWDNQSTLPIDNANWSMATTEVDNQEPTSSITLPVNNSNSPYNWIFINGTADDFNGSGVSKVWISIDNGTNWSLANLTNNNTGWEYNHTITDGQREIWLSAEDNVGNNQTNFSKVYIIVDYNGPNITDANLSKTKINLTQIVEFSVKVASPSGVDNVTATLVLPNGTAENNTLTFKNGSPADGVWSMNYSISNAADKNFYKYGYYITKVYANNTFGKMNSINVNLTFLLISSCNNGVCEPGERCRCSADCGRCSSGGGGGSSYINVSQVTNLNTTNVTMTVQSTVTETNVTLPSKVQNVENESATKTNLDQSPATGMIVADTSKNSFDTLSVIILVSIALGLASFLAFKFFRSGKHYLIK